MRILLLGEAKRHERFARLFAPVDASDGDTQVLEVLLLNVVLEFGQIRVMQLPHHLIRVEAVHVERSLDSEMIGVFHFSCAVCGAVECGVRVDVVRAVLGGELPGFSFQLLVHCLLAAAYQCEQRRKADGQECLASHYIYNRCIKCLQLLLQVLAEELPNLLARIHVGAEPVVARTDYFIEPHVIVCLGIHVAVVHNHVAVLLEGFSLDSIGG